MTRDTSSDSNSLYSLAGAMFMAVAFLALMFFGGLMAVEPAKKLAVQVEASLR